MEDGNNDNDNQCSSKQRNSGGSKTLNVDENICTLEDLLDKWVPKGVDIGIIVKEITRDKRAYETAYHEMKAKRIKICNDVNRYVYQMVDLGLRQKGYGGK